MPAARLVLSASCLRAIALSVLIGLSSSAAYAYSEAEPSGEPLREDTPVSLDVPYVPTPNEAVYRMLELVDVQPDDYLIDLGSGDGRIVIHAVRDWGVKKALGIDIDPERISEANENARKAGVTDRVTFERGDLFEKDFSDVDVLTMYLLPTINLQLRPVILEKLRPGTRIVSHAFDMGDWRSDDYILVQGRYIYKWIVPAQVDGAWQINLADGSSFIVKLKQQFQRVEGEAQFDTGATPLMFADLEGPILRFSVRDRHFTGRVDGNTMTAVPGKRAVEGWHAKRI